MKNDVPLGRMGLCLFFVLIAISFLDTPKTYIVIPEARGGGFMRLLTNYELLKQLEMCESSGRPIVIMDSNNKHSYGYLQFQEETFDEYGQKYNVPHDNILSREQQFIIADHMLSDKLFYHWRVCSRKLGLK